MTLRELEQQLGTFIADRRHDPVVDPITARAAALEAQLQTAVARHVKAQQAADDATFLAEQAYASGEKVDTVARQRLRAAVVEAADTVATMSRALDRVRLDMTKARAARAERDVATLTPIFHELVTRYHAQASALLEVRDVLERAHAIANDVLPTASSRLQEGYAGLITRDNFDTWCARVEAAGLLEGNTQRVA